MEDITTAVDKAIKDDMCLLEERQKMIRLADSSEYGWNIANKYEVDKLAEDSDDEKRIKAEKAAK